MWDLWGEEIDKKGRNLASKELRVSKNRLGKSNFSYCPFYGVDFPKVAVVTCFRCFISPHLDSLFIYTA